MVRRGSMLLGGALAVTLAIAGAPHRDVRAATTNISYDEIVKFAITSTPPPPGAFAADYAAITSPQSAAVATAAPKKRGMFGGFDARSLAHSLANGDAPGAVLGVGATSTMNGARDASVDNAMDNLLNQSMRPMAAAFARFANGTLERHAFYGNWERVDDVAGQTATIDKCESHERIVLDLAKKTYRIDDTAPHASAGAPAPSRPSCDRSASAPPAQPGTGVLDVTSTTSALAPVSIDGNQAPGTRSTNTIAIEHATGSCKNGSYTVSSTTYYSRYAKAHPYCPLPAVYQHPSTPAEMVQRPGGCQLRIKPSIHVAPGAAMPSNRLAYYELYQMNGATGDQSHPIAFVTERGNVRVLGPGDAGLFEVPAGFTKLP